MQGKRIVVADDESHILNVVSLKLRNAGFEVLCANDGEEALSMVLSEKPDLLITDYHMPGLTGMEVCCKMRADESVKETKAIMLSARGYHLTEQELADTGISTMISKPFSPRQLLEVVNSVLGVAA